MWRLVVLSFLVLGWGYYELSGGADFRPISDLSDEQLAELGLERFEPPAEEVVVAAVDEPVPVQVARGPTAPVSLTLASLAPETRDEEIASDIATIAEGPISEADAVPDAAPEEIAVAGDVTAADIIEQVVAGAAVSSLDIRTVTGSRVNMRSGPGTNHGVITVLVQGDETEVIEELANGWVRLRVVATGEEGYMAGRLLSPREG